MGLSNEAILRRISEDRALGMGMCFKHRHPQASPEFHVTITDLWRSADELVVIEAFREGAKSTLSEEFLLLEACFSNFRYCLIFGETYTKACQRLEAIKHEALKNMRLLNLFGKLKGGIWSENRAELSNGVLLEAVGWEQEIRGYKHHDARPDRAYLDDIENKERVRDTATVDANWRRLYLELIPAMDTATGKVRMTGTPLADDCMINRAKRSADWVSGSFPICDREIDDPEARSLWPERYPMDWIRKKKAQYEAQGMLREFNQEYRLIAAGTQGKPFVESQLRFEDLAPRVFMARKLIVDPARTTNAKSDLTGYVVVSRLGTTLYVHDSGGCYWKPDEIVSNTYDLADKYQADAYVEKDSLDEFLLQPLRAEGLRRGHVLNVQALNAPRDTDKHGFILSLQPFFVAGDVVLVGGKSKHQQLVAQLLNYPSGKRDTLNALAYATRVFSGVPVYDDFGEANIVRESTPGNDLLLGVHTSPTETAAVLVSVTGRRLTVMADWITPLGPLEAVPDILALTRAMYPGKRLTVWIPADAFDQVGRNPLLSALRSQRLTPYRAATCQLGRGSLSSLIRTELHGKRLLLIDMNASHVLNAITSGYVYPSKNGRQLGEPDRNGSRTLMEALECLTSGMNERNNVSEVGNFAQNVQGVAYRTALPRR